jgi:hypothetical protein
VSDFNYIALPTGGLRLASKWGSLTLFGNGPLAFFMREWAEINPDPYREEGGEGG